MTAQTRMPECYSTARVDKLLELVSGRTEDFELDRAALQLARVEYPRLDPGPFLAMLDRLAAELSRRLGDCSEGVEFVAAANRYLFEELRFLGNEKNYYDPRNSCLNDVLTFRQGIPITLSLVYMEIARRLGRPVYGIGLPGHFVVQYHDEGFSTYIDPFHGGHLLTAPECFRLSRTVTGIEIPPEPQLLAPVGKRQVLLRMAANLRGIYLHRKAYAKALRILNLLLGAAPNSAEEHRQRGLVYLHLKRVSAARADLEKYLALAPEATDRGAVEKQLVSLKKYLAGMN